MPILGTIASSISKIFSYVNRGAALSFNNVNDVAFGGGVLVAVGYNTAKASTSTDGITWTERNLPSSTLWQGITYSGSQFLAVANNTARATSPDGITWTARTGNSPCANVAYGAGLFVTIAYNQIPAVETSPD